MVYKGFGVKLNKKVILKKKNVKSIIKKTYNYIPFKKQLFSVVKAVWGGIPEHLSRHLHFEGIITVPVEKGTSFKINHYGFQIENELFWNGLYSGWEKRSMKLWTELCKKNQVIFDVGANTGVYGLVAQSINPKAKVYAFEPVKRVYDKLQANIELNDYKIKAVEKAASNYNGTATIYDTDSEHILSVTVNKSLHDSKEGLIEVNIPTLRLDTFFEEEQIKNVGLMKIDVETHELEVLEGMGRYLKLYKPTLLIEILNDKVGADVERIVSGMGYLFFNIDEKNDTLRRVEHVTKSDYYNYLFCSELVASQLGILEKK